MDNFFLVMHVLPELQKRADRADQSVLFFLVGAIFWEEHAKNYAILCIFVYFWVLIFFGGKLVGANFTPLRNYDIFLSFLPFYPPVLHYGPLEFSKDQESETMSYLHEIPDVSWKGPDKEDPLSVVDKVTKQDLKKH